MNNNNVTNLQSSHLLLILKTLTTTWDSLITQNFNTIKLQHLDNPEDLYSSAILTTSAIAIQLIQQP